MKNVWLHNVLFVVEVEVVYTQSNKLPAYCMCIRSSVQLIVYGSPE